MKILVQQQSKINGLGIKNKFLTEIGIKSNFFYSIFPFIIFLNNCTHYQSPKLRIIHITIFTMLLHFYLLLDSGVPSNIVIHPKSGSDDTGTWI